MLSDRFSRDYQSSTSACVIKRQSAPNHVHKKSHKSFLDAEKRAKGEQCYRGDYCLNISELTNQTNFTEVREYRGYAPLTHEVGNSSVLSLIYYSRKELFSVKEIGTGPILF